MPLLVFFLGQDVVNKIYLIFFFFFSSCINYFQKIANLKLECGKFSLPLLRWKYQEEARKPSNVLNSKLKWLKSINIRIRRASETFSSL